METNGTPTRAAYADDLYCPECGYSLRGLTSGRCPECGLLLDFIESKVSLIPWERRREIGRLRAYWRTVWGAVFRPKRFCRAAYQPVSYRCAQKFRWLTVAHAFVALLVVSFAGEVLSDGPATEEAVEETGWWYIAVVGLSLLLALAAFTGIPTYFFHPRYLPVERQNRAVALSYYGSGSLSWSLPASIALCVVLLGCRVFGNARTDAIMAVAMLVSVALSITLLALCWLCWSWLARYTLQRAGRRLAVTWIMPLISLVVCGLILVGLPLVAYFLAVVYFNVWGVGVGG